MDIHQVVNGSVKSCDKKIKNKNVKSKSKSKSKHSLINILSVIIMVLLAIITVYGYAKGYFTNLDELRKLVTSVGAIGPVVFILIQLLQVVFPVIPGGLSCLAGVILFGPLWGFVYNYVGISLGSFIVFGISKVHGKKVVDKIFPKALTTRYFKWVEEKDSFTKWFALAIFLPVAPDDLLCYIAGTTKMKWKEYIAIIILGKPVTIATYSMGLTAVFHAVS